MRLLLALGLLVIPISQACATPLDDWCNTATLPSSIAICSDTELRSLAVERQQAFDEASARLDTKRRAELLADQKGWVASYAVACGVAQNVRPALPLAPEVKACFIRAGRARIAYLRAYAIGTTGAEPAPATASAPATPAATTVPPATSSPAAPAPQAATEPGHIGPSFDCGKAQRPIELMICGDASLSRTDLIYVQAYQALRQQVGEAGQRQLRLEAVAFGNSVLEQCKIPQSGPAMPEAREASDCVRQAYEKQRAAWLARLTPAASEEATRPIEEHVALQRRVQELGFLPATAEIDGIYGGGTREAIAAWQNARGRPATGFLGEADARAITEEAAATGTAQPAAPAEAPTQAKPSEATPTAPVEELPQFIENESYASVRNKMIKAGWEPFHSETADNCDVGDSRCEGRPEMEACAGTGLGNCKFLWKKNGRVTAICTIGEDASYNGICVADSSDQIAARAAEAPPAPANASARTKPSEPVAAAEPPPEAPAEAKPPSKNDDFEHDWTILTASGERLVAAGALKFSISGWSSSLDVTLRDLSAAEASAMIEGACNHPTDLRLEWNLRVYLANGTLAGQCKLISHASELLAAGAAALENFEKTLREKPWMEGLLRAMGVNPREGPTPPRSPAEKRCQEMIERQNRECPAASAPKPQCTAAVIKSNLDQCVADLRQEWLSSH
ncbi:MAG: peptidoglycan-binding protein [Alphaproteobacteria bacterium]